MIDLLRVNIFDEPERIRNDPIGYTTDRIFSALKNPIATSRKENVRMVRMTECRMSGEVFKLSNTNESEDEITTRNFRYRKEK